MSPRTARTTLAVCAGLLLAVAFNASVLQGRTSRFEAGKVRSGAVAESGADADLTGTTSASGDAIADLIDAANRPKKPH